MRQAASQALSASKALDIINGFVSEFQSLIAKTFVAEHPCLKKLSRTSVALQ
jgi:hypothetical protein